MWTATLAFLLGTLGQFGYPGLFTRIAADPEYRIGSIGALGAFDYSPTHKYNGSGYSWRAGGGPAYDRGPYLISAGVDYSHTATDQWSKSATRPYIEGAIRCKQFLIDFRYRLGMLDQHNGLQGLETTADVGVYHDFGFRFYVDVSSFHGTDLPNEHHTGIGIAAGPQWTFRNRGNQ